jgi:hypothetical protein
MPGRADKSRQPFDPQRGVVLGEKDRPGLSHSADEAADNDDHPKELTTRVARLRRVETLRHPAIRSLIVRAIEAVRYPGADPALMYAELAASAASSELTGLFLGIEDKKARGIVAAMLPASQAMMAPQVLLVYSEGQPALIRALGKRLREWILTAGYARVIGMNLYRPDAVFMRGFCHVGEPRVLGSIVEFKL